MRRAALPTLCIVPLSPGGRQGSCRARLPSGIADPRGELMARSSRNLAPRLLAVLALMVVAIPASAAAGAPPAKDVDPSLYSSLVWRNIGPNLGGRSLAAAGSVARPNEYYFGATGGGLWKSTNGGTDWAPVTDQKISSSSVGAIAICPLDPDIVYIGTGEVDLRGDVISDGGATWTHIGLEDTQMIGKIRLDPTNCNRVFVAALGHAFGHNTERGVFRSTDGGATWQRVLYRDDQTGAVDLAMDPTNPQVLYAALWHAYRLPWLLWDGGDESGLFKTTDGGTTWTEITRNPGLPATGPIGKIGVSVSGANSNRG